jgi:hypothetical protein
MPFRRVGLWWTLRILYAWYSYAGSLEIDLTLDPSIRWCDDLVQLLPEDRKG